MLKSLRTATKSNGKGVKIMRRSFIVDEQTALMQVYFHNGQWVILSREQLKDGRWLIECRERV